MDQDCLAKAIEDLDNDITTEEPHKNVGENGYMEISIPVSPPRQSQVSSVFREYLCNISLVRIQKPGRTADCSRNS